MPSDARITELEAEAARHQRLLSLAFRLARLGTGASAVEPMLQDRVDRAIGHRAGRLGAHRGRLQPIPAVAFPEGKQPETRAIAHLRVGFGFEDVGHDRTGGRADHISGHR